MTLLDLIRLAPLMQLTSGRMATRVGLIDGPVALSHPDLATATIRELPGQLPGSCTRANSIACAHGTFVAGMLCAKRGSVAPAICPDCTLLVRPIFAEAAARDDQMPSATPEELAAAILDCLDAGAHVINISAALAQPSSRGQRELEAAFDQAASRGVIVVVAAGNQGTIGGSAITRHPWVIPIAGCDLRGRPINQSNLGGALGRRGLSAPGDEVTSLGADGKPRVMGGTSVAAPFVTGTAALLLSLFPTAKATAVKLALTPARTPRRANVVPPLLDAWGAYQLMLNAHSYQEENRMERIEVDESSTNQPVVGNDVPSIAPVFNSGAAARLSPQSGGSGCGCGCGGAAAGAANGATATPAYVFALGRIEMRFPTLAVEKEFAQATGRAATAGLTNRQAAHAVLSERSNRYIVRQLCWVLTIEGLETYLLLPRDSADYDLLLEAIRADPSPLDIDVVIGVRGPIAPPEMCNGLQVPVLVFDQIYSFDREALIKAIPRPDTVAAKQEKQFRAAAGELLDRIMQLADNAGSLDEHRAVNYLAVRYPAIYALATEANERNFSLSGVDVQPSRLSGVRRVVDVIFSFTHRQTDVTEKYFVRVDGTEEFPFLVTKMSPYFDR